MKFPIKWIKDFVDIELDIKQLAHQFNMHSLEVEEVIDPAAAISNVVVAEMTDTVKHPDADKLSVCLMNDGKDTYSVVCGAPNVRQGMKTALARVGAVLPNGMQIKEVKMRGQLSQGMNCSLSELGLSEEAAGIIELPDDAPVGTDICDYLQLEPALDIDILPNRGDVQSILGIAREIAAITAKPLKVPELKKLNYGKEQIDIKIDSPACYRYIGVKVDGVRVQPSPEWLQERLLSAGYRPINNLVDITNYLLMAYGQPMHVFDAAKVSKILVRQAQEGEKLVTLDEEQLELTTEDLIITDGKQPIALAGVMGGLESAISDSTTSIILESAFFDPVSIRKSSRRHALRSESSVRFEKGVDFQMVEQAARKALELILESAGGQISSQLIDVVQKEITPITVELDLKKMERLLDLEIKNSEQILNALGFEVTARNKDIWQVQVPTHRVQDVYRDVDLIEEIARINGYDRVPVKMPAASVTHYQDNKEEKLSAQLTAYLVAAGFYQTATYPMISSDWQSDSSVVIQNPLSSEESILRERLAYSLFQAVQDNISQQQENIALMEIANQYQKSSKGYNEQQLLSAVLYGTVKTGEFGSQEPVDFYYLKQLIINCLNLTQVSNRNFQPLTDDDLYHPGIAARIPGLLSFGQLHPAAAGKLGLKKPLYLLEIDIDQLSRQSRIKYNDQQVGHKFPGSSQDLAFLLPAADSVREIDLTLGSIIKKSELVEKYSLVDIYQGENIPRDKKSYTYRIYYRHPQRTLTEDEIMSQHQQIADQLVKNAGVIFR